MIHPGARLSRLLRVVVLAFLIPTAVAAQTPPATPSTRPSAADAGADSSAVVEELLVTGRRPGPALWRVTRGGSEVVILGALSPIPHLQAWDTVRVQHALMGAKALFLPPDRPQANLFDLAGFIFRQGALRPAHGDMQAMLSADLRARFDKTVAAFGLDPKRYRHWKPAVAGALLMADARRAEGLSEDKPASTVAKLARAEHVPVRTVGSLKAKTLFDAVARMTDPQHIDCLAAALDDVDREAAHSRAAAAAWAVGDLKAVRAETAPSNLERCLLQLSNIRSLEDQGTQDAVRTIDDALTQPGRSVAVIDLSFLLRRNGVLDRLKAEGDPITVPTD